MPRTFPPYSPCPNVIVNRVFESVHAWKCYMATTLYTTEEMLGFISKFLSLFFSTPHDIFSDAKITGYWLDNDWKDNAIWTPLLPTPDLEKHPIKLNYNKVPSDRAKIQIYFRLCSCRKRVACCLEFLLNETVCVSPCLCHPPIPLIRVKSIITRKLLAYSLQIIMDKLKFQYSEIRDFFSWDSFSFAQRNQYFDKLGA